MWDAWLEASHGRRYADMEDVMNQQDRDFGYETYARRDGDMSASNQRLYSKTQHPSREELTQYSRANYSSRKSKVSHGGSDNRRVVGL